MGKGTYKRRQYIVDSRFQYSLMSKFAIVTAFVVIGSLSFLVLVYYKYGDVQVSIMQPIPFGQADSIVNNEAMDTYTLVDLLWPVLSICLVGTIIFTFIFGVIVFSQNGWACLPNATAPGRDGAGRLEEFGNSPEK